MSQNISPRTQALLRSSVVWDNHGCLPLRTDTSFLPQLERYRDAGVCVVSVTVGFADISWAEHVRVLSFMRQWIALRPDSYRLLSTVEDVRRGKLEGKLGIVFGIEGMCPVQDNPSLVQTFYELGVRWMLIAYNRTNAAGRRRHGSDCSPTSIGRR